MTKNIYFSSKYGVAKLDPRERLRIHQMCIDIFLAYFFYIIPDHKKSIFFDIFGIPLAIFNYQTVREYITMHINKTVLHSDFGQMSLIGLILNTISCVGSNVIRLLARIHGQCELNCFVKIEHMNWFADIVQQGLNSSFLDKDAGWLDVFDLISNKSNSPIVLNYGDQYNFIHKLNMHQNIIFSDQWNLSFEQLVENNTQMIIEISPSTIELPRFDNGRDLFQLSQKL